MSTFVVIVVGILIYQWSKARKQTLLNLEMFIEDYTQ